MKCPYCNNEINKEDDYCTECGRVINKCPFCERLISKDDWKCPHCNRILDEKASNNKEKLNQKEIKPEKGKRAEEKQESLRTVGFWRRLGAYLIDYIFISIIQLILYFVVFYFNPRLIEAHELLLASIIFVLYHVFCLSFYSKTPGKAIYGLEINTTDGEKIGLKKSLIRTFSYFLSSIVLFLGFIWIAIDKNKNQGWHDKLAKTIVIKKQNRVLAGPILLSLVGLILFGWAAFSNNYYGDFYNYLGPDSDIIYEMDERLKEQLSSLCCFVVAEENITDYTNNVVVKSSFDSKTTNEIFNKFNEAVGLIKTDSGFFGSSFIISSDGLIVTNQHVIDGAEKIVAGFVINDEIRVFDVKKIINTKKPPIDIAILKVEANSLPSVPLGNSELLSIGDPVYAIGNPEGYRNTMSDGILSQKRLFNSVEHLQITASISGGSSGGPVINEFGEVVGVTTLSHRVGQNLNFAVPVEYVKEVLKISGDYSFEFGSYDEFKTLFKKYYTEYCNELDYSQKQCNCEYNYLIDNYKSDFLKAKFFDFYYEEDEELIDLMYEAYQECSKKY